MRLLLASLGVLLGFQKEVVGIIVVGALVVGNFVGDIVGDTVGLSEGAEVVGILVVGALVVISSAMLLAILLELK